MVDKDSDHIRALVLFSGGLDSILACKLLQEQGIQVTALKFITPFFGYDLKGKEQEAAQEAKGKYGITLEVVDISDDYLEMLKNPPHGFGRYYNPCIDCKILMIKKAIELLPHYIASFIATGEVVGQRPMSQRRDAMRIVERDSGAEGILLRPLSAKMLKPTVVEEKGLVDRSRLLGITGRGRKDQMALADRYGIKDYPAPAGGCVLADPILSERFKKIFKYLGDSITINDCLLAQVGRQFLLPKGGWLVVGRNQGENTRLLGLRKPHDLIFTLLRRPGPVGLLRRGEAKQDLKVAAGIVTRYSKAKDQERASVLVQGVLLKEKERCEKILEVVPISPDEVNGISRI